MEVIINPGFISGTVTPPASKSMMQRVCAAALLHKGTTTIYNAGTSDDDETALQVIQQLGATIVRSYDSITVSSKGVHPVNNTIDCGESGLSARMFIPIAALHYEWIQILGSGSLLLRPMQVFKDILPQLDVDLEDFRGYIPFRVRGPLQANKVTIDGSVSSQFLTGILFAFTAAARKAITIKVEDLNSKPYTDLTLEVLDLFGKPITNEDYETFQIDPTVFHSRKAIVTTIEEDWSSAAFWLVAGAISGKVCVKGPKADSLQADKQILNILLQAGASILFANNEIHIKRSILNSFYFDATDCPDLFPILSVLAIFCNGTSSIKGLNRLHHKESNREKSITEMLTQFGVSYRTDNDRLYVTGTDSVKQARIDGHNDHRIIMAAAVASLRATGAVTISDAESVSKSYPDFFKHLNSLGIQSNINN
ncbi:MAG: 3-phosphoshikimate 1-carboxyvinyltransferase [Bacteroidota bacterium]